VDLSRERIRWNLFSRTFCQQGLWLQSAPLVFFSFRVQYPVALPFPPQTRFFEKSRCDIKNWELFDDVPVLIARSPIFLYADSLLGFWIEYTRRRWPPSECGFFAAKAEVTEKIAE